MHIFLAAALSCGHLSSPLQDIQHIHQDGSELMQLLHQQMDDCDLNDFTETALEDLSAGDLIFLGSAKEEIHTVGMYVGSDKFVHVNTYEDKTDLHLSQLSDQELMDSSGFIYRKDTRELIQQEAQLQGENHHSIETFPLFLTEHFHCYFVNEQKLPLVISPKDPSISLFSFQEWAEANQEELISLIETQGALLLRNVPVNHADDFALILKSVTGKPLLDYLAGDGSRKRITQGVYTSTEAPRQFHIPLHNELSCTNRTPNYICFYCDIAPLPGTGQTLLGRTDTISEAIKNHPAVWNLFEGKMLRYISRHPPEGSFISKVNSAHKTWQDSFATTDKEIVEQICREKGFDFNWLGEWLEVIRLAPAMRGPDEYFDHPYWFNQAHLYHSNARLHGGKLNHALANLLYCIPGTKGYDIEFMDGSPIPQEIVYEIYDVLENETVRFDWQKNDVLIVHNKKALHGRAPCACPRRILTAMIQ